MFVENTFKFGFFEIDIVADETLEDKEPCVTFESYFVRGDERNKLEDFWRFEDAIEFIEANEEFYYTYINEFKTKLLPKDYEIKVFNGHGVIYANLSYKEKFIKSFDSVEHAINYIIGEKA